MLVSISVMFCSPSYLFCPWWIDYREHCCFQDGRVRVTLLARSTEYRRILNQAEVSPVLPMPLPPPPLPLSLSLIFLFVPPPLHPPSCHLFSFSFLIYLSLCLLLFSHSVQLSHSCHLYSPPLIFPPAFVNCLFKISFTINCGI